MDENNSRGMLEVFCIVERENRKTQFVRCGNGFPNKDGVSQNLYLDTLPLSGTLYVRPYRPKEARAELPGDLS